MTSMPPLFLIVVYTASALACTGSQSGDDWDAGADSRRDAGAESDSSILSGNGELVLPVVSQDHFDLGMLFTDLVVAGDGSKTLRNSRDIDIVVGEEFSDTLEMTVGSFYLGSCGILNGALEIRSVIADSDLLGAEHIADGRLLLKPQGQGDAVVQILGTLSVPSIDNCDISSEVVAVEIYVTAKLRSPTGADVFVPTQCRETTPLYMESGARLSPFLVRTLVEDGVPFSPVNATRAVALSIVAEGARISLESPFEFSPTLIISGPAGPVRVSTEFGNGQEFELVGASQIDGMNVEFSILGAAGSDQILVDGQSYGDNGWARTSDHIAALVSGLSIGSVPICTSSKSDDFLLTGSTAAVCAAQAPETASLMAQIVGSGECQLQLTAPSFDDGLGLSQGISVVLSNTKGLLDNPGR